MRLAHFAVLVVLVLGAGVASADEQIDNVEFARWAKFKPGATVTRKTTSRTEGVTAEAIRTVTLIEVGADKLVLEEVVVHKSGDKEVKSEPTKRNVPKTITLPAGFKLGEFKDGKPPGTFEEGTETIKIGGTEFKARWYKFKVETSGVKIASQMWLHDDMPGGVVRIDSTTTTDKFTATSRIEVTEFKKP